MDDAERVRQLMIPGHNYTPAEMGELAGEYRVWARRRFESLLEDGVVWKKIHTDRSVSYRLPDPDGSSELEGGEVLDAVNDPEAAIATDPDADDPGNSDSDALSAASD